MSVHAHKATKIIATITGGRVYWRMRQLNRATITGKTHINIMHNARIRSESAEGRPTCRSRWLVWDENVTKRTEHTLLYITEVKSDFQTNGQKNHEGHQRDPEPSPQGHWSPHLTAFVVLNNSWIFCYWAYGIRGASKGCTVAIFQRLFLEIWAIGCELPIYLIGFVEESLSWRPRQCVQT
jgi:hypothetical protein